MKFLITLTLLLLLTLPTAAQNGTTARRLYSGSGTPTANCNPGPPVTDVYIRTDTTPRKQYVCKAAPNIWEEISGAGGGNPGGSGTELQYRSGATFGAAAGTSWDNTNRTLTWAQGAITTDNPFINFTSTWNNAAVTFTALKLNITDSASAAASKFLDFQVASASKFSVDKTGGATATSVTVNGAGTSSVGIGDTDNSHVLKIVVGSNLSGDRNLTFTPGDAARNITLTGDPTLVAGTMAVSVISGTSALGTGAIASGTCASAVTTTATGTATTDVVSWGFNGDPTGVTGYQPSANGMLTIIAYPSANNVNFKVCNNTASSVTPGAITLNWRVVR
jgi:hypothetical protein